MHELLWCTGLEGHAANAEGERLAEPAVRREAGVQEDRLVGSLLEDSPRELDPVAAREIDVEERHVRTAIEDEDARLPGRAGRRRDPVAGAAEDRLDAHPDRGVILDHDDLQRAGSHPLCRLAGGHLPSLPQVRAAALAGLRY